MLWLEFSNATTIALYSCISINKILIWWKQDRYYQNLFCLTVLSCSFSPGVACPNELIPLHFESLFCSCFCYSSFFFLFLFLLFPLSVIGWLPITVATATPLSILQDAHLESKMIISFGYDLRPFPAEKFSILTVTCARGRLQAFASPKLQTPRTKKLSLLRLAVVHAWPARRPHSWKLSIYIKKVTSINGDDCDQNCSGHSKSKTCCWWI